MHCYVHKEDITNMEKGHANYEQEKTKSANYRIILRLHAIYLLNKIWTFEEKILGVLMSFLPLFFFFFLLFANYDFLILRG